MTPLRPCLLLLVPLLFGIGAHAGDLPIKRIFSAPDLSGPSLRSARIAPDAQRVTFLQGKAEDKDRLDLWEYDLRSGKTCLLVDSRALVSHEAPLADEWPQCRVRP